MHDDVKQLLVPYFTPDLKRYGGKHDGAYILSENLLNNSKYVYSYGVGNVDECILFDKEMALLNKDVFLYDGTIDIFWQNQDRFYFKKENVNSKNIYNHIHENNHINENNMILKMDIETHEYETLLNCDKNIFSHFNQIAIEIHGAISNFKSFAMDLFKLLNINYYLVHIHGNNHDILVEDGICNTLELTYIRKDCFSDDLKILEFSCPRENLDYANNSFRQDIIMNWWLKQ
jgi:hypothetical protein